MSNSYRFDPWDEDQQLSRGEIKRLRKASKKQKDAEAEKDGIDVVEEEVAL